MAWPFIAEIVISLVISIGASYLLRPKPESQPPPGLGDVKAPTAQEGIEIPVLFGTRDLKGPNVVWYGDFRSVPIKKRGGKK